MSAERYRRDQIRSRRALTCESHQRALVEFDQHGVLPGTRPSIMGRWQRRIEHDILTRLGRGPITADLSWPANTVLGIRSVTPRPDLLLIDLHPRAVVPTLHSLLPVTRSTTMRVFDASLIDTVTGVPGLRARPTRAGLELTLLNADRAQAPGTVILRGVTTSAWSVVSEQLLESYGGHEEPVWFHRPNHFCYHEYDSFLAGTQHPATEAARASGLLRRIGLLSEHGARAVDIDTSVGQGTTFDVPGWPPRRAGDHQR